MKRFTRAVATGTVVLASGPGCDRVLELSEVRLPADAPRDLASEGIPDALGTHDEDGDLVVDRVDNCPAIANSDQDDGDQDGVGDVCDPHPTLAIDRIRHFDPLVDFSAWTVITGQWVAGGDTVTQTEALTETLAVFSLDADPLVDPSVLVTIIASTGYDAGAYLIQGPFPTTALPVGTICYLNHLSVPDQLTVWDRRNVTGNFMEHNGAFAGSGFPVRILLQASTENTGTPTGTMQCSGVRPEGTATTSNVSVQAPFGDARIGIYTWRAVTIFASVTIYDRKP